MVVYFLEGRTRTRLWDLGQDHVTWVYVCQTKYRMFCYI